MKIKNIERYCLKAGIAHTIAGNTATITAFNHTLKVFVFADGELMVTYDNHEPEHWRENRLYDFLRNVYFIQTGNRLQTHRFHRRHDGIVIVLKK